MADIERVESPDAPNRCQAVTPQGQCMNKAVEGCTNCLAHGGAKQRDLNAKEAMKNYRLTKAEWTEKAHSLARSSNIKSLRDEIALLRVLMQEHLDACRTSADLLLKSHIISDLVLKIDKVVSSCHKLETSLGQTLDKAQILHLSSLIIDRIGSALSFIDDPNIRDAALEAVAEAILQAVSDNDTEADPS